ncbi:MAG: ABC transporter permease, partial [Ilumatobacteraceae bacterium]
MTGRRLTQPFAGTAPLTALVLRRDRLRIALWGVAVVGLVAVSTQSILGLYDTPAKLAGYARLSRGNAALIVQAGPGYGLDHPTTGAVVMNEVGIWTFVAIAVMNIFMVVRHTRAEEDGERAELLLSTPIGFYATLASALLGAAAATVVVAAGVAVSLVMFGLPTVGAVAFSLALVGLGLTFSGLAAVAAQVAAGARSALALGGGALAVSFVLRAIGDVGDGRLSWVSPLGWAQAVRAFANERWWTLVLLVASAAVLSGVAIALRVHRDLGAGLLGQRPGRARARPSLSSPLGLAFRLHRATIIGWSVGMALLSGFYGVVADQAKSIIDDNPDMADFFAQLGKGSITDVFLATAVSMMALLATGYTVSAVLRLRTEETAERAAAVLATPVARLRWLGSHLLMAAGGTVVVMAVTGVAMGVGFATASNDPVQIPRLLLAALAMVPAMWVMAGVTVALYAVAARWAPAAWAVFAFAVIVGLLGSLLDLPSWSRDLSPFQHVPA